MLSEPGGVEHEMLSGFDLGRHVRELKLDALKVRNRLPELTSHRRIPERVLERAEEIE